MNKKYKLLKSSFIGMILASNIMACSKNVDCHIEGEHIHLYVTNDNLKKYIEGEKERDWFFHWTENYVRPDDEINLVVENSLCLVEGNEAYIKNKMYEYRPKREAYVYDYIYGPYYGYGYHYDYDSGEYEYGYGLINGYHYDYEWQEIDIEKYTDDKVRDTTYEFKFYKITEEGILVSKNVSSFQEIEDYPYFKENDFVIEKVSAPYYLENEKVKKRN